VFAPPFPDELIVACPAFGPASGVPDQLGAVREQAGGFIEQAAAHISGYGDHLEVVWPVEELSVFRETVGDIGMLLAFPYAFDVAWEVHLHSVLGAEAVGRTGVACREDTF
jgi:hypothetical protein